MILSDWSPLPSASQSPHFSHHFAKNHFAKSRLIPVPQPARRKVPGEIARQVTGLLKDSGIMKTQAKSMFRAVLGGAILAGISAASAQEADKTQITEKDKEVFKQFADKVKDGIEARKNAVHLTTAVSNARQIGLALFEFENDYGSFPSGETAADVKQAAGTTAKLGDATANDCFYQLIAAKFTDHPHLFTFHAADPKEAAAAGVPDRLEECAFSYFTGQNAAGNPNRPLVVAPLVKGQKVFDRTLLGGKAVILRVDNSVQSFPIDEDGRVMLDGKDIFDPTQPFWNGNVPEIRWPKD